MRVNNRLVEIYNNDFSELLNDLRTQNNEQRRSLYKEHSSILFPKSKEIVNLEDQLSGREDYMHKFKKSFFVIGNYFFSSAHYGNYNQEVFIQKTGYGSQRYPQKVILALSMLGYITGMECNYSVANHGYIYKVDYWKYKKWNREFYVDIDLDCTAVDTCSPPYGKEWLVDKQLNTISSMSVRKDFLESLVRLKDFYLDGTSAVTKEMKKQLKAINEVENLYYKSDSCRRITVDGENGRLYSIMTRMKSDFRHSGCFHVQGEQFKEVDISNSQPTLLGLRIKRNYQTFISPWLEHCIKGDFYEWVVDITGLNDYSIDHVISNFKNSISKLNKRKGLKDKAENDKRVLEKVMKIKSEDKHVKFRPLVKNWIMSFLYCKEKISRTRKDKKDIQGHFNYKLCQYLEQYEPLIFEEICWFRKYPMPKKKNPHETSSELARKLQEEEVRFIKECLKNLGKEVEYIYTVHDCIGCLESDVNKVKSIMEQTAIDYYGVKLNLKVE